MNADREEQFTDQYIPTLLNEEPVVLFGVTESELMFIGLIGGVVGVIFSTITGFAFELGIMNLMVFLMFFAVGAVLTLKWVKGSKEGKPRGYLSSMLKVRFGRVLPKLFNQSGLYLSDENMMIGRSVRPLLFFSGDANE